MSVASLDDGVEDLLSHLARVAGLSPQAAARLLDEVTAYFSESLEAFVVRRHAQLQSADMRNEAIFAQIARELEVRRFAAPRLTQRQIRRLIYG
jgi:GTP cyclohydrolase II